MQRSPWPRRIALAALVLASLVLFGCASALPPPSPIFEAPNVIHVCIRPPNVPKNQRSWAVSPSGMPITKASEVDLARHHGLGVYVFDANAPPASAKLLPIPYHRLACPERVLPRRILPPKPRVVVAKVEPEKKKTTTKTTRLRPLPRPIVEKRCSSYREPGQTRKRASSSSQSCTRTLIARAGSRKLGAGRKLPQPREVPPPSLPPLPERAAEEYKDWGIEPADVSALAEERGRECLQGLCHARHPSFIPKKKPAEQRDGQSLSNGGKAEPKPGSSGGPGTGKRASPSQRKEALDENQGNCVFCGKPAREADHAIPRSRGGDTTTGPDGNLQPTCRGCNRQKGTKTSEEYLKWKRK